MMKKCVLFFYFLLAANTVSVAYACLGGPPACIGGCSSSVPLMTARTRALAAPPHRVMDPIRAELCPHVGIYRASELRSLATLYEFAPLKSPDGAINALSCRFNVANEPCGWYTVIDGDMIAFRRAIFQHAFDLQRFECTQERGFPFDDHFLLAGADAVEIESSAAIETRIACQLQRGLLKFNYWSNNNTPILKICVLSEGSFTPQCDEAQLDANPLTFEIPASGTPFLLRILVENIGTNDIVFVDSIDYQASFCSPQSSTMAPLLGDNGEAALLSAQMLSAPVVRRTSGAATDATAHLAHRHGNAPKTLKSIYDKKAKPIGDLALLNSRRTTLATQYSYNKADETSRSNMRNDTSMYFAACQTLTCDFSANEACGYQTNGLNTTGRWRLSGVAVGNPHTGIHRANPNDRNKSLDGFAYVGVDDAVDNANDVEFVLESPSFVLMRPALLLFDFFQRSLGPELKVCVNDRFRCPYRNPPLLNSRHWHLNQLVILNQTDNKVYFVASKLHRNQYIGVDNVRLIDIGGAEVCSSTS